MVPKWRHPRRVGLWRLNLLLLLYKQIVTDTSTQPDYRKLKAILTNKPYVCVYKKFAYTSEFINTWTVTTANMNLNQRNRSFHSSCIQLLPLIFAGTGSRHNCKDNFSFWFQLPATCYHFRVEPRAVRWPTVAAWFHGRLRGSGYIMRHKPRLLLFSLLLSYQSLFSPLGLVFKDKWMN